MRNFILAAALSIGAALAAPALAQTAPVKLVTGSAETCTGSPATSGGSVILTCPGGVYVVPIGQPIRYSTDVYRWNGREYVAQFTVPNARPVLVEDPRVPKLKAIGIDVDRVLAGR